MSLTIKKFGSSRNRSYTYRDLNFRNGSGESGIVADDILAIRNSMVNLLTINRGSRILDPNYGSDIKQFLFETASVDTGELLEEEVREALSKEDRISVDNVLILVDKEKGVLEVEINFSVPELDIYNNVLYFDVGNGELNIQP